MGTCNEGLRHLELRMPLIVGCILISISLKCISAQISTVPTPPYFTKQPKHELLFQVSAQADEKDKPFVLECEAKGQPPPKYTWYKNGLVFQSDVYDKRINRQADRGTLVFISPAKNDEGLYQCNATNIHGTAMSNAVYVRKSELNSFPDGQPSSIAVEEGEPYTLVCNPPSGFPKPSIFWILQSSTGALRTINSSRITVDPEGNLHFSNITQEDASDDNMYACSANSMFRNEYKLGNKIRMNVISTGGTSQSHPPKKQYDSPPNIAALRGRSLELSCIYGGTPLPQFQWRRKNGKLPHGRHTFKNFGKTLRIRRIEFEDQGTYECEVSNGVGPSKSHAMSVSVQAAPYWLKVPDSINMAEEEDATFECEARGVPEPKLQWFINGVPIEKAEYNPRRTLQGTKLMLTDLKKTDTSVFQCNASNTHGYVYNNFYVNVMSLPPTITRRPENMKQAVIGSNIIIPCKAEGAPVPKITWTRSGKQLTGGRYEVLKEGLKINSVQKVDEGLYKCRAVNKLAEDSAEGSLVVKSQTVLTTVPTDFEVAAGKPATFRCSAKADDSLPLNIIWLRNGEELDYELVPRLIMTDDHSLRISKTVELDSGTYTCKAQTSLDFKEASATLTVQDVPNRPLMLGVDCDGLTAMVKWRPNGDNRASINNFIIEYNTSFTPDTWVSAFSTIPSTDSKFKISMTPYANYTFRVIAQNKIGKSPPSEHSNRCVTPPDRPYKNPDNVEGYGTTSTNLVIKWNPMPLIEHNGPGFRYNIYWKRADIRGARFETTSITDWTESHIVIPDQPTFKPYIIKVEAYNDKGQSHVTAVETTGYSGEDVPLENPQNFTLVRAIDPKTYEFKWDPVPPESLRGHFKGYKIQTWTTDSGEKNIREMEVPSDTTFSRVNIFVPNTKNKVHVLAYNGAYNGPPSKAVEFQTPEGVPGAIPELDAFPRGASILHLRWLKPEEPNGALTGYKIEYQVVKGTTLMTAKERAPITNPDETETIISGLEPGTTYRITVRATTSQGPGDPFFIEVTTRSNVTGPPDAPDFKVTSLPEDNGKSVLRVEVKPAMNGNPGSTFKVEYRRSGESQWSEVNLDPDQYWTLVRGLEPSTKYDLRVIAIEKDDSTPSAVKTLRAGYSSSGYVSVVSSTNSDDDDAIANSAWLIGMLCAIALLLLLLFLVCLLKRNRGGKYSVHKKEAAQGRDLDYPDDGGFNEYSKPIFYDLIAYCFVDGVNPKGSRGSLNSSVRNPESETDSMAEYGDGEGGQFTEDGSFIGQYGAKNRKERADQDTTSPSALATFV
ncbi:Neuroglian [Nymphon striatum]|nr:Neuroglian [Nymphon striatum]